MPSDNTVMENEPTPDEIQRRMAAVRSTLLRDVQDVKSQAKELVDWRHHFRQHPLLFCGVAAAAGYLLVPRPRPVQVVATVPLGNQEVPQPAERRPIVAALAGIALNVLSKQTSAYLAQHGSEMLAHFAQRGRRPSVEPQEGATRD